jgi:hypothetical protein
LDQGAQPGFLSSAQFLRVCPLGPSEYIKLAQRLAAYQA